MNAELDSRQASRRQELLREDGKHPTPDQIATLMSGSGDPNLRAHVVNCRRCFGLYAEMAESDISWRSGTAEPVPDDLIRVAKDLARPPAVSPRRHWLVSAPVGIAAAAAVVAVSAWFVTDYVRERSDVNAIRPSVALASSSGMVLTEGIALPESAMRSGTALSSAASRAISDLSRGRGGLRSEEIAYWVAAGMLVEPGSDTKVFLVEAVRKFPRSTRIKILAAVEAWRDDDPSAAESKLTEILRRSPGDPVALFNLTYLLKDEPGRFADYEVARKHLFEVLEPGSPLRARADEEFGTPHSGH